MDNGSGGVAPIDRNEVTPEYVTIPRASRVTGYPAKLLRTAAKDGALPVYAVPGVWPRVKLSEVRRLIESTRVSHSSLEA